MKRQTQSKDLNIGDEEGGNLRKKYVDTYVATFYEILKRHSGRGKRFTGERCRVESAGRVSIQWSVWIIEVTLQG